MIVRVAVATVAGGIVSFGGGFVIYGLILQPMMQPHMHTYTNEFGSLYKEPPSMIPLVLANLTIAFLVTFVFEKWASIRTFATGAMGGAIIFFLTTLYFGFSFFAFMRLYKSYTPLLMDLVGSIVLGAITGGVIGLVLGLMSKKEA